MKKGIILSIDLGTTGNRVFCINDEGKPLSYSYLELTQIFPKPGWVEHNPEEIWNAVCILISDALAKGGLSSSDIISIGITNQRETTLLWDVSSGKPLYNAIVWQCRRSADICTHLRNEGHNEFVQKTTGLVLDPYFSATKIKWILESIPEARECASKGNLRFGTVDTWILWKLTGEKNHATDYTNASRTLLLNINTMKWDDSLLSLFDIPKNILPTIQESASFFGRTLSVPGLPDGIPIGGIAGDQQAALAGQNCTSPGTSKNTYGTGCFLLQNTGQKRIHSKHGLLTTLACNDYGKPCYALEGSVFIGGAVIQWLRDNMGFIKSSSDSGTTASSVANDDEIVFVPAFSGLGAPHWDMHARGAIFGITRDTKPEQIVRAAEKSIALQSCDLMTAMENDSGESIKELRVDGGAVRDAYLMQYQADMLGKTVLVPHITESTALGAAYLSGITSKLFSSISEVAVKNTIEHSYKPALEKAAIEREKKRWQDAIRRLTL
jgi:glycerol kinase